MLSKLVLPLFFFNGTARKFESIYVAAFICLLNSTALERLKIN